MNTLLRPLTPVRSPSLSLTPRISSIAIRPVTDPTLICRPFSYDHVVIGAGVVGLAIAARLAELEPNHPSFDLRLGDLSLRI